MSEGFFHIWKYRTEIWAHSWGLDWEANTTEEHDFNFKNLKGSVHHTKQVMIED